MKDSNRQSRLLEELTGKMKECKRLIKDFDREIKEEESRNPPDTNRLLNEKKQSMIKELNSYVALRKTYANSLENKRVDLFDAGGGGGDVFAKENVQLASSMTNQQLVDSGNRMMDDTDQVIERSKKVVEDTINVGADTAAALKAQTEQMSRIVNELDSIHFSIKKASQLVKEIGRQVATDRCILALLFLIVCGVIAIIIVKTYKKPPCPCWQPTWWVLKRAWAKRGKEEKSCPPGDGSGSRRKRGKWRPRSLMVVLNDLIAGNNKL
ncbi:hypothetical protein AMTR_s00007p00113150 [Amborella trichopoda]|uniref:t-SNARE coiled-coil homology domain-containing protein n=1 Tax=Amborella trichopoda TaxID=13333 RepID=W1P5X4_AMBTC|nr:hypothetical protein AMTR_s00007p00113150 [Amborella trichopoda]